MSAISEQAERINEDMERALNRANKADSEMAEAECFGCIIVTCFLVLFVIAMLFLGGR